MSLGNQSVPVDRSESRYRLMARSDPKKIAACFSDRVFSETTMSDKLEICESIPSDLEAIESLYPEVFPDENLLPLVGDLLEDGSVTTSLVGAIDSRIVGNRNLRLGTGRKSQRYD